MKIDVQHRGAIVIVRPAGQMTGDGDIVKTVTPMIEQRGARVVIDMGAVEFVSSGGLGELVRITAQANAQGARVVLAALTPFIGGVLATTRLDKFFETHSGVDAAISALT